MGLPRSGYGWTQPRQPHAGPRLSSLVAPSLRSGKPCKLKERGSPGRLTGSQHLITPHALLPAPLSPYVGEGWRSRGEGNSVRSVAGEGTRTTTISLPLTPRAPLPRRELGERGSLRRPSSLHSQPQPHSLLPAPLSPYVGEGWRSRGEGNGILHDTKGQG